MAANGASAVVRSTNNLLLEQQIQGGRGGGVALVLLPPDTIHSINLNSGSSNSQTNGGHARKPLSISFGLDCNEWETGPLFKGIKLIPPGLHFIYYYNRNEGSRSGFFKYFAQNEVIIKQWNIDTEDMYEDDALDAAQVERLKSNILEFDRFLGPYPLIPTSTNHLTVDMYQKWLRLTSHITPSVLARVIPIGKVSSAQSISIYFQEAINSAIPTQAKPAASGSSSMDVDEQQQPNATVAGTTASSSTTTAGDPTSPWFLHFTTFDLRRSFPTNATPDQITKYSLDKSHLLQHLLSTQFTSTPTHLLGELQLAFVLFLIGQVYDGFEHWKQLMHLLCLSREAVDEMHVTLYEPFLVVLHAQLEECPEDFFVDAISSSSFLRAMLLNLVGNIRETTATGGGGGSSGALRKKLDALVVLITARFKWDVEEALLELQEGRVSGSAGVKHNSGHKNKRGGGDVYGDDEAPVVVVDESLTEGWTETEREMALRKFRALTSGEDDDEEYAPVIVELDE